MAQGSRLPCKEGVRVGVMPNALTFLSTGTGEPDAVKVARPVRRGAGRKGGLTDLARGLPYLVPRSRFRQQLRPGVRLLISQVANMDVLSYACPQETMHDVCTRSRVCPRSSSRIPMIS